MGRILIQAFKKRAFLRQIAEGAKASSTPLKSALIAAQSAVFSPTFQKGRLVVSQSGSGQSGSFQVAVAGSEWTQDNIAGLTEELIGLLETVFWNGSLASTVVDDGNPVNTEAIRVAMFEDDLLAGETQQLGDWTGLNIPSIGGIPGGGA